jgi:hypothetical protein
MTRSERTDWAKKLAAIAAALTLSGAIVSWLSAQAWSLATRPIIEDIRAESAARKLNDERLVGQLRLMSRDRLDLVDVMMTPPGKGRDLKLSLIREKWAGDDKVPLP